MTPILLDTGPLVAIASPRDPDHEACLAQMQSLKPPLLTTWAVLTEADYLLRNQGDSRDKLYSAGAAGMFEVALIEQDSLTWIADFLRRYDNIEAQLADATLVYLAEHEGIDTVFTLDRRDFSVYRFGKNRTFKIIPE
jgi:predicted nucleic acid-binding protein